jgi:hypothetical protein
MSGIQNFLRRTSSMVLCELPAARMIKGGSRSQNIGPPMLRMISHDDNGFLPQVEETLTLFHKFDTGHCLTRQAGIPRNEATLFKRDPPFRASDPVRVGWYLQSPEL